MPTYDYVCGSCEHAFEQVQRMKDAALTTCPRCGTEALKRLIGMGAAMIMKTPSRVRGTGRMTHAGVQMGFEPGYKPTLARSSEELAGAHAGRRRLPDGQRGDPAAWCETQEQYRRLCDSRKRDGLVPMDPSDVLKGISGRERDDT